MPMTWIPMRLSIWKEIVLPINSRGRLRYEIFENLQLWSCFLVWRKRVEVEWYSDSHSLVVSISVAASWLWVSISSHSLFCLTTFKVFNMEGRRFISAIFASEKAPKITQVVMNLPNDAAEYLGLIQIPFPSPTYIYHTHISLILQQSLMPCHEIL